MVAYLQEDIQDLRNEVRENRQGIQRLDTKINARTDELRQEIGELRREMNVQFRWMVVTMVTVGGRIVATLKLLP